jgi:cysteine desulfurase
MLQKRRIYFDNAATTALDERVLEAMLPFLREHYGNPSSVHAHGREVRAAIEKARKKVAELLNTTPGEVFFTSGGTEADNTAIFSALESLSLKHIITSPLEHHAVLHITDRCVAEKGIKRTLLDTDGQGNLDLDQLKALLQQHPNALVSLMHGNNEIGNINDIEVIGNICQEFGAFFHSDTVQTVGHYVHRLNDLPLNAMVGSAHKFHGPKGSGFLYVNKNKKIKPYILGGSQERNMRGGTENVAGIIGLAKALEIAYEDMEGHRRKIIGLKKHFKESLESTIPGVSFNGRSGDLENSLYTVLNVSFPASSNNQGMLLFNLDLEGISASGGSACSSGATLGSHVLRSLQVSPEKESVRFSFSRFNTVEDVDYTVGQLRTLYEVGV